MAQTYKLASSSLLGGIIDIPRRQINRIILLGIIIGVVGWLLSFFIHQFILSPLYCGVSSGRQCLGVVDEAGNVASVIVGFLGLLGLVKLGTYRPLLVVLSVVFSLWGLGDLTAGLVWYESILWWTGLYVLSYLTFSWLVRPRAFAPMFAIVIIAVVLIHWLPTL